MNSHFGLLRFGSRNGGKFKSIKTSQERRSRSLLHFLNLVGLTIKIGFLKNPNHPQPLSVVAVEVPIILSNPAISRHIQILIPSTLRGILLRLERLGLEKVMIFFLLVSRSPELSTNSNTSPGSLTHVLRHTHLPIRVPILLLQKLRIIFRVVLQRTSYHLLLFLIPTFFLALFLFPLRKQIWQQQETLK